jgi:hypothetical protein
VLLTVYCVVFGSVNSLRSRLAVQAGTAESSRLQYTVHSCRFSQMWKQNVFEHIMAKGPCYGNLRRVEQTFISVYPSLQETHMPNYVVVLSKPMLGVRVWSSHCATSREVTGSVPGGILGFFIDLILLAALWPRDRLSL